VRPVWTNYLSRKWTCQYPSFGQKVFGFWFLISVYDYRFMQEHTLNLKGDAITTTRSRYGPLIEPRRETAFTGQNHLGSRFYSLRLIISRTYGLRHRRQS
jgi:hypothetical protein